MNKIKILIVDDYSENILALSKLIASDQVEILSAQGATEALELIYRHEFGLALLDVQMPEISGFELANTIRSVKRFYSLPIIFVTAHEKETKFVFDGYQTGAVDLLFKPLDPDIVRAKVQVFVEMARQKILLQNQVEELEKLRFEAQSANVAKGQFLANMSHEIRTPLSAVMGFADLITQNTMDEKEREYCASAMKRNGDLLMHLIDEILDFSKIEANRFELEKTVFHLPELLQDIQSTVSFRAKENSVTLNFNFTPVEKEEFVSDPVRIKQVLLNVIGNAIKFSPGGTVIVDVSLKALDVGKLKNKQILIIQVRDNGIGLTHEQQERIFQPFSQADASTRRRFGGSGLGLIISRQIAKATGGDLKLVYSRPGLGTTFQIELLLNCPSSDEAAKFEKNQNDSNGNQENKFSLQGLRVLAVDDSPDNLTLISFYLRNTGAIVSYAENAQKAIIEVRNNNFDIILMDIQMPGMDGHEATEEIRRQGFDKPIVALTAHILREEHVKSLIAGCNSVLTKPVTKSKLIEHLYRTTLLSQASGH